MSDTISINLPSLEEAISALKTLNAGDEMELALNALVQTKPESSTGQAAELVGLYTEELGQLIDAVHTLCEHTIALLENTGAYFNAVDTAIAWSYDEVGSARVRGL